MKIKQIIQEILKYETIIIHRHVRPDPDAYGSQVGLKKMIKHSFPKKKVYAVGEEDSGLDFLARMDDIPDELYKNALVIVCDTANTERISDERYSLGEKLIKIDHHPNHDPYGDIVWVDTKTSSTSELIFELYEEGKDKGFKLNKASARLLYAGIVGDTGRFLFPSTTEKTFQIATKLFSFSFDFPALYQNLYNTKVNIAKLQGYILQNFSISQSGVSAVKLPLDILEKYGVDPLETGKLISVLGNIKGVVAWVFFIEEDDELIRVRLRSKGPAINELAANYGGGGHPLAAGAEVSTWEEADQLTEELNELCRVYSQ